MGEGVEIKLAVRAVVVVGCRAQGKPAVVLDKVAPPEWQKAGPCWNPNIQGCDARSEKVGCGHCGAGTESAPGWSREGARAGGGTRVVEGGAWYGRGRNGGWPQRAFLRIGTLVIRRTGSSLLVVVEGDGGGGLWEALVAERPVCDWSVLYCLGGEGAGTGGVFGGGEEAEVVAPVMGWTPNGVGWVGSAGSSLIDSDLISCKSGCSTLMAVSV